jgi:signal peptide peptidase SppA
MTPDPNMPMVGDRVKVVGKPHMAGHEEGVVRQAVGMALGIEFDATPGEVHQWYVTSEVMVTKANKPARGKGGGGMDMAASGPGLFRVPFFPRATEYVGAWAIESRAAAALAQMAASPDLAKHMAAPPPVRIPTTITESGKGGKSIARVVVRGTLMKGQSSFGGTSTVQLRRDIRQAAADPNVSAILLDVDSPGGTVAGTADLAAEVRAARRKKPVWAHIDDLGASAAYWVASQADQVFANDKTALVGSIGTLMTVYDFSAQAEKEGVKALVFATGPLKGAGAPGTPVDESQRAYFQKLVDDSQASFDAAVRTGRGMTAAELAAVRTGGVFTAAEALDLKLIDGIRSLDRTLEALAQAR